MTMINKLEYFCFFYYFFILALGLVGVDMTPTQFLKKYPQYEAQKYIVKEQFITILTAEYKDRLKVHFDVVLDQSNMLFIFPVWL